MSSLTNQSCYITSFIFMWRMHCCTLYCTGTILLVTRVGERDTWPFPLNPIHDEPLQVSRPGCKWLSKSYRSVSRDKVDINVCGFSEAYLLDCYDFSQKSILSQTRQPPSPPLSLNMASTAFIDLNFNVLHIGHF